MTRLARAVVGGVPHHVTQRGNRRQPTFLKEEDYGTYVGLMAAACAEHGVSVLCWCLMPNHVHLIAVPAEPRSLALGIGRGHWRYTRLINFRENWRGYLWQGRFGSCAMDGEHALAAARYVERNPVRAGLVREAWQWPWSSAAAHVEGRGDALIQAGGPLVSEVSDWRGFLAGEEAEDVLHQIRRHARTGRPLGGPDFVVDIERRLGRILAPCKPGPRPDAQAR